MGWFEAIVLGVVQGLTEFLPISSSAHLRLVGEAFGWDDPGAAFTAITQIGTEAAVLLYFRHDIARIIGAWVRSLFRSERRGDPDARMGWLIIVGSIPIVVLGLLFQDQIETDAARPADRGDRADRLLADPVLGRPGRRQEARAGRPDRVARHHLRPRPGDGADPGRVALRRHDHGGAVPGLHARAAARYSFLLAIPAVLGSGFFQAYEALTGDVAGAGVAWGPTILATVLAFGVGLAVIAWLLRYLAHGSFVPFVVYRIALGVLVLVLVQTGVFAAT